MLRSIIVPFYNAESNCQRLLETLSGLKSSDIELLFVDDGSVDGTRSVLTQFSNTFKGNVKLVFQDNKGPGGARNTGLMQAVGKYVWFVDCDDDICLESISCLRELDIEEYDFIGFNYMCDGVCTNSMKLVEGGYEVDAAMREKLLSTFGRLCTKIFNRNIFDNKDLYYPEFCIYEDNALLFIYPFLVKRFFKANNLAYYHHQEFSSVTRSGFSIRYLDRLHTSLWGFNKSLKYANGNELRLLSNLLLKLYLLNTVKKFTSRGGFSYWILAARVMKQYRVSAGALGSYLDPKKYLKGSFRRKSIFVVLWFFSYLLPDQHKFFQEQRLMAWKEKPSVRN